MCEHGLSESLLVVLISRKSNSPTRRRKIDILCIIPLVQAAVLDHPPAGQTLGVVIQ